MNGPGLAALRARFAARRCTVCGSDQVIAVCPGSEAVWETVTEITVAGGTRRTARLISSSVPEISLCLAHRAKRPQRAVQAVQR